MAIKLFTRGIFYIHASVEFYIVIGVLPNRHLLWKIVEISKYSCLKELNNELDKWPRLNKHKTDSEIVPGFSRFHAADNV